MMNPLATWLRACLTSVAATAFVAPTLTHAGTLDILYSFRGIHDGIYPYGGLVHFKNKLYGTTFQGPNDSDYGTIFSLNLDGSHKKIIHSFDHTGASGVVPEGLVYFGGKFFGMTQQGGANNEGVIYSISPEGVFSLLHSFGSRGDGAFPFGTLVSMGGSLYGSTAGGGSQNFGTVFAISPQGVERVIHDFANDFPFGAGSTYQLTTDGAVLYGTTQFGGGGGCFNGYGCGTVFSMTPHGALTEIFSSFHGNPSGEPDGGLIKIGNELYGTTSGTGDFNSCGSIFKVSLTGHQQILHAFDCTDGGSYGLTKLGDLLYGVTANYTGGSSKIFSISVTGAYSILYSFPPGNNYPSSNLYPINGVFYGETSPLNGPPWGTIFSYTP